MLPDTSYVRLVRLMVLLLYLAGDSQVSLIAAAMPPPLQLLLLLIAGSDQITDSLPTARRRSRSTIFLVVYLA